ncbi:MAG: preprotein translocase subunit SecE [Clostridia bacterium]|nr:preprotein translocase subunit SecE [Clostridia bacterium]
MSNEVTTNNNVAKDNKEKKPGFFKKMAKFFKDMKSEAKKVVWPNKKQVINNTAVAIAAIVIVGVIVGGLDAVFAWLRNLLISVL